MYDFQSIYEAGTVADAVSALVKTPGALILAGGTDVLIRVREGALAGCSLVSIAGIPELRGISLDDAGNIHIGPLTTFRELQQSPIILENIPVLAQAAGTVGSPQLRAVGTIGGNISNGYTTADLPPSLLALNARAVLTGPDGTRDVPVESYYIRPEKMDLKPGELLTDIVISRNDYAGFAGHYIKYAIRNALEVAVLGCCAAVRLDSGKTALSDVRLSFAAAGPLPLRAKNTEAALRGQRLGPELLDLAGTLAPAQDVSPITDKRASKDFRLHLIAALSQDALRAAVENAGGHIDA